MEKKGEAGNKTGENGAKVGRNRGFWQELGQTLDIEVKME